MTYQKCVKHIAKTSNSKANNGVDNGVKEWHQRPENKARMKAYREEYSQKPENKARAKAYWKAYRPRGSLFYKQYGITMTEMGRIMGVSKEAIRKRFVRLNRKMDIN